MYVFVSLPAPTQMSERHCLDGKKTNSLREHKKPQTLDYHENTGGPNGPEYSKQ